MDVAKVIENGKGQSIELPREYHFYEDEIFVNRINDMVLLIPKDKAEEYYWTGLKGLEGVMEDGRGVEYKSDRVIL